MGRQSGYINIIVATVTVDDGPVSIVYCSMFDSLKDSLESSQRVFFIACPVLVLITVLLAFFNRNKLSEFARAIVQSCVSSHP